MNPLDEIKAQKTVLHIVCGLMSIYYINKHKIQDKRIVGACYGGQERE